MTGKQRHWGIFALNFLMFFLSLTLFGGSGISLAIGGVAPILVITLLTVFSSYAKPSHGALVGLLCGMVADSISTDCYCFNSIALLILGVMASLLAEFVFNRNLKATVVLCFVLTLVYYLFYWLIFISLSVTFRDSIGYFISLVLPSCLYTAVLAIPFYFIYKKFSDIKNN